MRYILVILSLLTFQSVLGYTYNNTHYHVNTEYEDLRQTLHNMMQRYDKQFTDHVQILNRLDNVFNSYEKQLKQKVDFSHLNEYIEGYFNKYWNSVYFDMEMNNRMTDKLSSLVPNVWKRWSDNNLQSIVNTEVNRYNNENYYRLFEQKFNNSPKIQKLLSKHMDDIDNKVTTKTDMTIRKLVDTSDTLNPIFLSFLDVLETRNQKSFDNMKSDYIKYTTNINNDVSKKINNLAMYETRIEELENDIASTKIAVIFIILTSSIFFVISSQMFKSK